jgi:hypothetical protein
MNKSENEESNVAWLKQIYSNQKPFGICQVLDEIDT